MKEWTRLAPSATLAGRRHPVKRNPAAARAAALFTKIFSALAPLPSAA
jgi:hypothetical protein